MGIYIATTIKESLDTHNINIKGQRSYDGAAAIFSNMSGVQIHTHVPLAVYTHCRSQVINLSIGSIAATCQIPEVRNMIDAINSIFLFFHNSLKRQNFLSFCWM